MKNNLSFFMRIVAGTARYITLLGWIIILVNFFHLCSRRAHIKFAQ